MPALKTWIQQDLLGEIQGEQMLSPAHKRIRQHSFLQGSIEQLQLFEGFCEEEMILSEIALPCRLSKTPTAL